MSALPLRTLRADWETAAPASAQSEAELIAYAEAALPQVGAVVLSDYAKGVMTPRVICAVIDAARRLGRSAVAGAAILSVSRAAVVLNAQEDQLQQVSTRTEDSANETMSWPTLHASYSIKWDSGGWSSRRHSCYADIPESLQRDQGGAPDTAS